MQESLKALIENVDGRTETFPSDPVLVYGAGSRGREMAVFLLDRGYRVLGFADIAAKPNQAWRDLPVRTLVQWRARMSLEGTILVVGIHNHRVPMAPLLDALSESGARRVINPVEFHALFPLQLPDAYWLTSPATYRDQRETLGLLGDLFEDATSRDLLDRVLAFRMSGNYSLLPAPSQADQYCPQDLPRWKNPLRLVDCGACDGDSLRQFRAQGYDFAQLVAFEPDPVNFAALSRQVRELGGGVCMPCGVRRETGLVGFESNGTGSSRISESGGHVIQCVSIDAAVPGLSPTLIKMDIEGAEPDALLGARQTISTYRPGLAISVYHCPAHLWEIPFLIASWDLGYRFHVRMHGHSSFDLVLYALPNG
ncbi:MAG: hypothetical protein A3H95_06585 [Acidobacteria bacterium RIFCSPLOWO2_02_FULL_64_15]|nr:MAG: hypothetical protein A3H95_06585 [Acidobacteria bacterium RIFCSPLOWO2_02_FULL_64_15]